MQLGNAYEITQSAKLEQSRKVRRAERLREWLNVPENRMRSTYEVIASDYRKLLTEIECTETESQIFNPNNANK